MLTFSLSLLLIVWYNACYSGRHTSKFWKIVCEGEKVRARGCISSSAWYKLSFEPSTNSVRFVLFLYYKFMQQKSTNCTNSLNKKTHPNHKVTRRNVQMWLMAQMKAYTMPMKNCTLLCGPFHFRRLFSRTQMWLLFICFDFF